MTDVRTVAKWFLAKNRIQDFVDDGEHDGLTNLKLQKLLYYAQGASYFWRDEPMFKEDIEAWHHGPVVPEIYHLYKSFGSQAIQFDESFRLDEVDQQDHEILDFVYDNMAIYSAWYLRNLTHEEKPWRETELSDVIQKEKIRSFFQENFYAIFGVPQE